MYRLPCFTYHKPILCVGILRFGRSQDSDSIGLCYHTPSKRLLFEVPRPRMSSSCFPPRHPEKPFPPLLSPRPQREPTALPRTERTTKSVQSTVTNKKTDAERRGAATHINQRANGTRLGNHYSLAGPAGPLLSVEAHCSTRVVSHSELMNRKDRHSQERQDPHVTNRERPRG